MKAILGLLLMASFSSIAGASDNCRGVKYSGHYQKSRHIVEITQNDCQLKIVDLKNSAIWNVDLSGKNPNVGMGSYQPTQQLCPGPARSHQNNGRLFYISHN